MRKVTTGTRREGFSLVEVIVAATVSGFISIGVFSFFLTTYKIGFVNQERNRINADIRGLTGKLIRDGRQSNYFVIYESTSGHHHDEAKDRRLDGESGDVLVFVYTTESDQALAPSRIARYVCYFRALDSDGGKLAPVKRFEKTFSPASDKPIEELVMSASDILLADETIELSRGLVDGKLFYNFWGRSVMVNGQIFHGNEAKRVTETYNFTISPRG